MAAWPGSFDLLRRGTGRRRNILGAVALAFLPLVVLAFVLLVRQSDIQRSQTVESRILTTKAVAATAETFLDGNLATLAALAKMPQLKAATSPDSITAALQPILSADPNWITFGLSGADGWNLSSFTTPPRSTNISDRDYFRKAISGSPAVSAAVIARSIGMSTVILAVPIEFDNGTRGVMSGALKLDRLATVLTNVVATSQAKLTVIDSAGQVFIGADAQRTTLVTASGPDVDAVRRGQVGSLFVQDDGVETLSVFAPVPSSGWGVIRTEPTATAFLPSDQQLRLGMISAAGAALLAIAIAWVLAGLLTRSYARIEESQGELARAHRRAEGERRWLEEIFTHLPALIAVLRGPDLKIAFVNPAQLAILSHVGTNIVGKRFADLYPEDSDVGTLLKQVYETGEPKIITTARFHARQPEGGFREAYYDAVALPTRNQDGVVDGVMYHAVEVTELVEARTTAERALALRDEFLAVATHELRTPLTTLRGFSQLARRWIDSGTQPRIAHAVQSIDEQADRLVQLSEQLLDVARLESGRLPVAQTKLDLTMLIQRIIRQYGDSNPAYVIDFKHAGPLEVMGDEVRLEQLFTNLLSNAIKYSPEGGSVEIVADIEHDMARVRVRDHGIGVPEEARGRLFERFFRAHSSHFGGVGLGLYVARQIVELHNGSIAFEPAHDGGAIFIIHIPLPGARQNAALN